MRSAKKEIIVGIGNIIFFIVNIYIFKNVKNYNINTDNLLTIYHFSLENIIENIAVFIKTFELTDHRRHTAPSLLLIVSSLCIFLSFVLCSFALPSPCLA